MQPYHVHLPHGGIIEVQSEMNPEEIREMLTTGVRRWRGDVGGWWIENGTLVKIDAIVAVVAVTNATEND